MKTSNIIALDVGSKRIGVACASTETAFAVPLITLNHDQDIWRSIEELIKDKAVAKVVVGLPRNLEGKDTDQTRYCQSFADELSKRLDIEVQTQDEALTSRQAEDELKSKGRPFNKDDIDALAATYILEDYLNQNRTSYQHEA